MGCVSSKLLRKNLKQELLFGNGDVPNHVVSLTSSTYGVLKLDQDQNYHKITSNLQQNKEKREGEVQKKEEKEGIKVGVFASKRSPAREELEVINTWELMGDLEEEIPISNQSNKSPKLRDFQGGYVEKGERSPFNCLVNQVGSPKGGKKLGGKENRGKQSNLVNLGFDNSKKLVGVLDNHQSYVTPAKGVLKSWKFSTNSSNKQRKASSLDSPRRSISRVSSSKRRSLSPLFDPELIDSFEKELSQEEEQIKKMVSPKQTKTTPKMRYSSRNYTNSSSITLEKYVEKCPPGGENSVVIYTTTLRGIRKTFEDCNAVRSIIESYQIRVIERDVSMDSGFKEELRKLMGTKVVNVPLVFVKGRLIGGANEVVKLEEEGKLEGLFEGIPKAMFGCEGCGGIRFVMCMDCNGSCKVLDEDQKNMLRCGECNENGLIQCPLCC